jgi:pimeloyl-ACP methyl ester carboxylesterase
MTGLTAVLLSGNMCDARMWRGNDDALRSALSRRGVTWVVDADCTMDDSIAAMAFRALAQAEGQLLTFGFSMGAIVAAEMAAIAPDRIAGMVLAGYNATADLPDRAAHRPVQQSDVRAGGLEELKPNYLAADRRGDAGLLTLLRDMGMGLGADVFLRQSEALRNRESRVALLPTLSMPVLYGCGLEDALCPPAWHREWAAITPEATLAEFAGVGHMLPLEAATDFADTIGNWIDHHRGSLFS